MRITIRQLLLRALLLSGVTAALVVGGFSTVASAQTPLATCNGPTVHADRTVTLCLTAPQASSVVLLWQSLTQSAPTGVPSPMTRQENGIWVITVGPLDPSYYGYAFTVDGVQLPDPSNRNVSLYQAPPIWPGPTTPWSFVFVPGPAADYMDEKPDVRHGTVSTVYYRSNVLGSQKQMLVYTPPGYNQDNRKYPVLYLYPGGGGMNTDWTVNMRANFILDNLIAEGKAEPMIIVMAEYNLRNCPNFSTDLFTEQLMQDVIPTTEKHFRVLGGAQNRALAGLSSGAGCTYHAVFKAPGEFAYYGLFSPNWPARGRDDLEQNHPELLSSSAVAKINKATELFWITRGGPTDGNQVPIHQAFLDRYGVKNTFVPGESYGATFGHVWDTWRKALLNFTPQLFKNRAGEVRDTMSATSWLTLGSRASFGAFGLDAWAGST